MRHVPLLCSLSLASVACGAAPIAAAQPKAAKVEAPPLIAGELGDDAAVAKAIREYYTKYEFRIPMRDGVKLFTAVYVPKDASRKYPIMLLRTPYGVGPYGADNYPPGEARALSRFAPSRRFIREGFVFAHQDVRGRMMSEGQFVDVRPHAAPGGSDESTDAWDTIDWLVKNAPENDGKVGAWGISYPGFYAAQAAVDAHPALKAVSPQAPVTDWFVGDDFHHNGAFFLAGAFGFYASFGKPRPKPTPKMTWGFDYDKADSYDFFLALGPIANANTRHFHGEMAFWNELMDHGALDAYWQARNPRPYYKNVKPAVMTVGGWFDAEDLFGALETYRAFETQSPGANNFLVMGPWRHGGWARSDGDHLGDVTFGAATSRRYRDDIEYPFFRRYLKDAAGGIAEAEVFETGTNTWRHYSAWPPPGATSGTLFFQASGGLASAAGPEGADEYLSDPRKPVPYRAKLSSEIDEDYMSDDQRFAARRPDVLVYQTGELDADVVLSGPIEASLWLTTSGSDADFVVKLVDVYPEDLPDPSPNPAGVRMGGYQQLVRAEIMRGKFRDGFDKPAAFSPGEPALVKFALPDVCHAFRSGHRIMVQVQSSWFPLVDRNPQTFVDIYHASDADFRAATIRVLRGGAKASALRVTVTGGKLP